MCIVLYCIVHGQGVIVGHRGEEASCLPLHFYATQRSFQSFRRFIALAARLGPYSVCPYDWAQLAVEALPSFCVNALTFCLT
jgi:hypothetical protein